MARIDTLVVGGGVMGCAAAYALSKRGVPVRLLEAGCIGQGSSQGRSRIIRLAYGSATYIALCRAAYRAWQPLEDEAGEILLYTTGGIDLAAPETLSWQRARAAMAAAHVPFEEWGIAEIKDHFPQFNPSAGTRALYQADAGVLHADRCILALAKAARKGGAEIVENCAVHTIHSRGDGIIVESAAGTITARHLVPAAGAAMPGLAAGLGLSLPLTVSLEQVAYFRPRQTAPYLAGRFPLFITHGADGRLGSGFPLLRDPGMKLMLEHKAASRGDSDVVDTSRLAALRQHAVKLLPDLSDAVLDAATCHYTLTNDEDFILDRHPDDPRIVLVSPCSGHGFKFGALFGTAVADLVAGQAPEIDLAPFALARFANHARKASVPA